MGLPALVATQPSDIDCGKLQEAFHYTRSIFEPNRSQSACSKRTRRQKGNTFVAVLNVKLVETAQGKVLLPGKQTRTMVTIALENTDSHWCLRVP